MAIFAVLHTPTRVVRRLTTDAQHAVSAEESLFETKLNNLANGPWVVEINGTIRRATPQEIDDADVDAAVVESRRQLVLTNYLTACDALANDDTVPAKYRTFFTLHAKIMRGLTR